MPDVSANAGGNMFYHIPSSDLTSTQNDDGTSASTPLWASLAVQFNAVFHDQGLPNLGYMNDLLYIAAAIAPASFNDVTLGNNTSSFVYGGAFTSDGVAITPTGFGYLAGPGYDLATGLGSPNGLLLTRALTDIAHSQMWFGSVPELINSDNHGGWTSGADQTLLFQTMSAAATDVGVHTRPRRLRLLQHRVGKLRLDEPVGAAIVAARLRPQPGHPVRQAGAGRRGAGSLLDGRGPGGIDQHLSGPGDPGHLEQPVRLCRLLIRRR